MASDLRKKERTLQTEIDKYKDNQKDIQKCVTKRKQLEGQLTENKSVQEELDMLEDGAVVYKLIGPVLIKQELNEAKSTVVKRLEYINREIDNCEQAFKDYEKKQESMTEKLAKLQQEYQQALTASGEGGVR